MNPDFIDNQIKAAIRADDPAALELIWKHYAADMLSFLQGVFCSSHDAEDALQQIFVKLIRLRGRLVEVKNLRAYLYRITRNEALDLIKKQSQYKSRTSESDNWLMPRPSLRNESDDKAALLKEILSDIPQQQRLVILLKIYRRKTFQEIAEFLDISQNTAASRYRYGIQKLRTLLDERQK